MRITDLYFVDRNYFASSEYPLVGIAIVTVPQKEHAPASVKDSLAIEATVGNIQFRQLDREISNYSVSANCPFVFECSQRNSLKKLAQRLPSLRVSWRIRFKVDDLNPY